MGGEFPNCGALSGVSVVDSPILLLVCFHKALRAELSQLHSHATLLSPASLPRSLLLLHQRFTFLRTIYKYHCTAEDEVIFRALDLQVKNVAGTYSLEHNSINDLFDSVFYWLDRLLSNGYSSKSCQELALCTGTLMTSICQHMQKEEEQVFPLLVQRFSFKEQASLAWLFMCSVPIILLEDFLPWMISYLSKDEQEDVLHSIKEVVPKERLLQEVVTSWLGKKSLPFCGSNTVVEDKIASCLDKPLSFKKFPEIHSSKKFFSEGKCHQRESDHLQEIAGNHPIDGLCLWHGVIKKELKEILEELQNMRRFQNFTSLSSISSQIMFIADVLIFYSDALEKVIFPALNECVNVRLSFSHHRLAEESQIHGLLSALQSFNCLNRKPLSKLVEELCWQLESFMIGINQQFEFQELEVLPLICKTFDNEMQQKMLYNSLLMMPLGLLKCMVTWISVHLTEDESKTFLGGIKLTGSAAEIEIACLLHEWLCNAYLGKTSLEIFRKELQELFKTRSSFISDQSDEESGLSLSLNVKPCRRPHTSEVKTNSAGKAKDMKCSPDTCSDLCSSTSEDSSIKLHNSDNCSTSYSSGINLQIFFSETFKKISSFSHFLAGKDDAGTSVHLEPKPIDHIFHFHKALGKDLEYLVTVSANMIEEFDALLEFRQRFHVVQVLYQAHSYAEDEIAFPALEAKGTLQNISGAYTVDHKLEEEHFKNIAIVLDEISELHSHLSSGMTSDEDLAALDPRMPTYRKMCVKLHGMCKSMQTALGHHVFREEVELWPLFLEHFSEEEQETIIGCIIGRTKAEILQAMIPWLMASLSPSEQNTMMSSWHKATKNTMFDEWLGEWWEGMERNDTSTAIEKRTVPSENADPLEVVAAYLSKEGFTVSSKENLDGERCGVPQRNSTGTNIESSIDGNSGNDHIKILKENGETYKFSECTKLGRGSEKKGCQKMVDIVDRANRPMHLAPVSQKFTPHQEHLLTMSQDDLEAAIRKVSQDPTLEPHKRSYLIQNLLMSRWIISQQFSDSEEIISSGGEDVPGRSASYRDPLKSTYGCEHYKRNCKLLTGCCNQLFTCRYCHDNTSDHSMDRKSTTKMMCMKCLLIQPMGPRCSKLSCNGLSMARYFCNICKLFDDEREIYHCPFCNLCRVGKGLGIDYFHCMNCNACMSKSLAVHICREKCFESNCPICHEYIFTSSSPVKALPCGHLMHSTCFQVLANAVGRTTLVLTTPVRSVASHWETCRYTLGCWMYCWLKRNFRKSIAARPRQYCATTARRGGQLPSIGSTTSVLLAVHTTPGCSENAALMMIIPIIVSPCDCCCINKMVQTAIRPRFINITVVTFHTCCFQKKVIWITNAVQDSN